MCQPCCPPARNKVVGSQYRNEITRDRGNVSTQHSHDEAAYSQTFGDLRDKHFLKINTRLSNHPGLSSPLPLRVRILSDGGAKLSVESVVSHNHTPLSSRAREKQCSVGPLKVRVLNGGGAKLRVTSVVSPNEGHRDQEWCADQYGVGSARANELKRWGGRRDSDTRRPAYQPDIESIGDWCEKGVLTHSHAPRVQPRQGCTSPNFATSARRE